MTVLAHQTWFVHHPESYPLDLGALARPVVLVGVVAVVLVALAWRAVATRLGTVELRALRPLGRLAPWTPRLLAGVLVRPAAWAVVAAGPVLLLLEGPRALLACLVLLGIAGFLVLLPPDPRRQGAAVLDPDRLGRALLALRVGTAGTLLVLAVVEKLANPAMGEAMLAQAPVLNLLSPLAISDGAFVVVAGLVEVLFALLVLSGAAPQVVALVAAVPFTASLALFGGTELIGHLPVYGVLLTLLVLGSSPATAPQVRALTPVRS